MPTEWTSNEARRDALIAKFTDWLDAALEDESPPEGIDAALLAAVEDSPLGEVPEACSEYDVWSSLTSLTQEVKLQGRTFRNLTDTVTPLQASMDAIEASRSDLENNIKRAAEDAVWRQVVDVFLDLRDRIARGRAGLRDAAGRLRETKERGRLLKWLPGARRAVADAAESVDAVEQGNALVLERIDEALARTGIQEIPADGCTFDSNTMKAIDVEIRGDLPEGTVFAVHRNGYAWRGETYRLAEVTVTRPAADGESNT